MAVKVSPTTRTALRRMLEILLEERGDSMPSNMSVTEQAQALRALCNARAPDAASDEFLTLQDAYLREATAARGVVHPDDLQFVEGIAVWQGDITRLATDAIVNAGNDRLLGCFEPLHGCVDNAIHSWAGVQVRLDCNRIMQGERLATGDVRHTPAYNLPCRFIFHTVGPIVRGAPSPKDVKALEACYVNSLALAETMDLDTIAFCGIATGLYGYPAREAAVVATRAVRQWHEKHRGPRVVFDVWSDDDREHYEAALLK